MHDAEDMSWELQPEPITPTAAEYIRSGAISAERIKSGSVL